jgi:hypothetical protein
MHEKSGGQRIAVCNHTTDAIHRREPEQHELAVAFDGFDLSTRKMLLESGRVIDKIRLPKPHGQNPPAQNRSAQAARYCLDFGKFRHGGITNKISHPLDALQAGDTNPMKSAIPPQLLQITSCDNSDKEDAPESQPDAL